MSGAEGGVPVASSGGGGDQLPFAPEPIEGDRLLVHRRVVRVRLECHDLRIRPAAGGKCTEQAYVRSEIEDVAHLVEETSELGGRRVLPVVEDLAEGHDVSGPVADGDARAITPRRVCEQAPPVHGLARYEGGRRPDSAAAEQE